MESFLVFANFYQQFIKNFSHIVKPLNELKGKKGWKWEEEHKRAFEELKDKITSQPVLALLKRDGKEWIEIDASEHTIREVLSQEQEGKWKPIAFLSRTMQPAERNYEIYNKELLTIVEALTKWRQYLLDTIEKFKVWTDHENIFILYHIPGNTNIKADVLSRKDQVDMTDDNEYIKLLKNEL